MPNDVVADHSFTRARLAGPLPLALTLTRVTGVQSLHKTVQRPVANSCWQYECGWIRRRSRSGRWSHGCATATCTCGRPRCQKSTSSASRGTWRSRTNLLSSWHWLPCGPRRWWGSPSVCTNKVSWLHWHQRDFGRLKYLVRVWWFGILVRVLLLPCPVHNQCAIRRNGAHAQEAWKSRRSWCDLWPERHERGIESKVFIANWETVCASYMNVPYWFSWLNCRQQRLHPSTRSPVLQPLPSGSFANFAPWRSIACAYAEHVRMHIFDTFDFELKSTYKYMTCEMLAAKAHRERWRNNSLGLLAVLSLRPPSPRALHAYPVLHVHSIGTGRSSGGVRNQGLVANCVEKIENLESNVNLEHLEPLAKLLQ